MNAKGITPILNVSDFDDTFAWFDKVGWSKRWDWGDPPSFGCVGSGHCEIFLCLNAQGGKGKGRNTRTFGEAGGEEQDKGVWLSIWVDDVDAVHAQCVAEGVEVLHEPEDMPWHARELHIRHPDGHVFRVSQGVEG
ncbi:MAG: bleomycin resistance family protein [Pseudomonadota bacterium]